MGKMHDLVPAGETGSSVATLELEDRVTFYTRFGDVFAYLCDAATLVVIGIGIAQWWKRRSGKTGAKE